MFIRYATALCVLVAVGGLTVHAQPVPDGVGDPLQSELKQRHEVLAQDDAAGRMALAQWCEHNQLTWEAARLYAELLLITHDDLQAYDRLVEITGTYAIPEDEQLRAKLQEEYPGMKLHSTNHYLIVFSADENLTRNLAALLEKTHDAFFENFKRVDYKPIPVTRRLIVLYFGTREEYLQQDRRDSGSLGWAAGYYTSRTNRAVFYDSREGPWMQRLRDDVAKYENEAKRLADDIRKANQTGDRNAAAGMRAKVQTNSFQLARARSRLNNYSQNGNVSVTIHEATHQLAFNTGIQKRGVGYPFWITEGIATNFQTDDFTKPFGPFQESTEKDDMIELVQANQLMPLDQQITIERVSGGGDATMRMYRQSWALFNFLVRYRRDQLKKYLFTMAAQTEYKNDPQLYRQQFVDAFGEPAELEPHFQKFLKQLR